MRLIGIKLLTAEPVVKSSLFWNTWYPFGNYEEPDLNTVPIVETVRLESLIMLMQMGKMWYRKQC